MDTWPSPVPISVLTGCADCAEPDPPLVPQADSARAAAATTPTTREALVLGAMIRTFRCGEKLWTGTLRRGTDGNPARHGTASGTRGRKPYNGVVVPADRDGPVHQIGVAAGQLFRNERDDGGSGVELHPHLGGVADVNERRHCPGPGGGAGPALRFAGPGDAQPLGTDAQRLWPPIDRLGLA